MYNNPPRTLFVGQQRCFLPVCHSTNTVAAELLESTPAAEGTVVIAAHQTQGRGQRGNTWQAEPAQNLTFSLVLKPGFLSAAQQFRLNIAVSLAVHDFLDSRLPGGGLRIKWPNDIYWQNLKMGGILIENAIQGTNLSHSIIGIGLNINQLTFPGNLRATSLLLASPAAEGEDGYDLEILLNALLESLEKRYLQLRGGGFAGLERYYLETMYGFGQTRTFRSGGHDFEGVIAGIDETGRLAVRKGNETRHFSFKEIEFVF